MKKSKKFVGALIVLAVVVGSSLTAFASSPTLYSAWGSFPAGASVTTEIKNNNQTAVGVANCYGVSYPIEYISLDITAHGAGGDRTGHNTSGKNVPTCQVSAQTGDERGFTYAVTNSNIRVIQGGQYVDYNGFVSYP